MYYIIILFRCTSVYIYMPTYSMMKYLYIHHTIGARNCPKKQYASIVFKLQPKCERLFILKKLFDLLFLTFILVHCVHHIMQFKLIETVAYIIGRQQPYIFCVPKFPQTTEVAKHFSPRNEFKYHVQIAIILKTGQET